MLIDFNSGGFYILPLVFLHRRFMGIKYFTQLRVSRNKKNGDGNLFLRSIVGKQSAMGHKRFGTVFLISFPGLRRPRDVWRGVGLSL